MSNIKNLYVDLIDIYKPFFSFFENNKYFSRYGLNKVKNIVILSNFKISRKILKILQKIKKLLVDINKIYIRIFKFFSNLCYLLRYSLLIFFKEFELSEFELCEFELSSNQL